jgi:hypothetical protein
MISERAPSRRGVPAKPPPSVWPGVLVGAALGAVVGVASLFVPLGAPPPASSTAASTSSSTAPSGRKPSVSPSGSASAAPAENETDYLHRAQDLLAASPAEALALAEAHPVKYPDGKLGQEREMIAIRSLAALGRKAEARARARLFLTLFPASPYRERLETLLPGVGKPESEPAP